MFVRHGFSGHVGWGLGDVAWDEVFRVIKKRAGSVWVGLVKTDEPDTTNAILFSEPPLQ